MLYKTLNLARQSLAKTFTHGYAQSVVAASQSSYASQNHSFGAYSRFSKSQSQQPQTHFSTAHGQSSTSSKPGQADHHDGLAAYYAAWQKHARLEDKEWQQFQFRKSIEWKATPPNTDGKAKVRLHEDVAVEEDAELAPARGNLSRAYSTSAVDDHKRIVIDEPDEAAASTRPNESAAEETIKDEAQARTIAFEGGASVSVEDGLRSPTSSLEASVESFVLSDITPATSVSAADTYAEQLNRLAESQHYAEIPAVFEAMLLENIKPTATAYHALLAAAIRLPRSKHQVVPKALDIYSDMLHRRVLPDSTTYAILIELLSARTLDVVGMKQVLEEKRLRYGGMEEEGKFMLQSNKTESDILSEDDSLSIAVKLYDTALAIDRDRAFAEKTYRVLVAACAETGRLEDMVRIYEHMEAKNILPCADLFVPMIHAFGTSGDLRSAVECYDEYKAMAIANDKGEISMTRKDNHVYAALIKAYLVCERPEGAHKFLGKIESELPESSQLVTLRDSIGLRAFIPAWLRNGAFADALSHVSEKLSLNARNVAMAAICVKAADKNSIEVATTAFSSLGEGIDLSVPAMAMGAMHIRNGNIEAAEPFWFTLETSSIKPQFIEATVMHAVALIGSGRPETGLRRSRQMFTRIRDAQATSNQAKLEVVEQIDEAIEVVGQFMSKRNIMLPAKASMELMWTMVENGGLVLPVANHLLAGLGPEGIAELGWKDLTLLMQVQAGMIINASNMDVAHEARFAHLLDVIIGSGMTPEKRTATLIEKVLIRLDRADLAQRWQHFYYPASLPAYTPSPYPAFSYPAPMHQSAAVEDAFDPYAATTDNKGSVAITDLLEKTHGRSSSHLNEALSKFKNMRRAGRHPRFFAYAKLITAAAKENRLNLARDILALARQDVPLLPQYRIVRYGWVTILDAMVAACLTTGQRQLAAQYHQDLLDMGAAPSANTFGLYITTLKESTKTFDEATEAVKIFLRAKSEGVEPSSFLYNALIGKLGKARRIDDCLFYFAEMRNHGIRPTSVTYGTIVNALCRVSDEKFAEELFEEMESMPNYKPRPAPYHSLMQFFLATKRDRSKVLDYYNRMRARNVEPTAHTYKLLIDTYATLDPIDMPAAEAVLDQIRQTGGQPEAVHYASLIHAKGCVQHDMAGARSLFDAVLADTAIRPQACLYQALFESMVANHEIEGTEAVLADMKARGVDVTPYIANALIHGWAVAGEIEKAEKVYEKLATEKREPSTYEAMTRAFLAVEDREGAVRVVNEGLKRGYPAAVAGKILELVGGGRHGGGAAAEVGA
ncbi:hypothetical protein H2201_002358 [Coniosporium apollinis]|uniref:Pentacotripeptide-repeat region of PRORP domain-containing protein n=1 Tax=Coniosporium apollinis TaxID=61459 RepID=A0ABQ9P1R7_9PEZI|nr:hypothetical protein H2201_002358 [Coniosporium apollinis]